MIFLYQTNAPVQINKRTPKVRKYQYQHQQQSPTSTSTIISMATELTNRIASSTVNGVISWNSRRICNIIHIYRGWGKLPKLCARCAIIAIKMLVMMTLSVILLSGLPIKNLYNNNNSNTNNNNNNNNKHQLLPSGKKKDVAEIINDFMYSYIEHNEEYDTFSNENNTNNKNNIFYIESPNPIPRKNGSIDFIKNILKYQGQHQCQGKFNTSVHFRM